MLQNLIFLDIILINSDFIKTIHMNTNIMKTKKFHKMKNDLNGQIRPFQLNSLQRINLSKISVIPFIMKMHIPHKLKNYLKGHIRPIYGEVA